MNHRHRSTQEDFRLLKVKPQAAKVDEIKWYNYLIPCVTAEIKLVNSGELESTERRENKWKNNVIRLAIYAQGTDRKILGIVLENVG